MPRSPRHYPNGQPILFAATLSADALLDNGIDAQADYWIEEFRTRMRENKNVIDVLLSDDDSVRAQNCFTELDVVTRDAFGNVPDREISPERTSPDQDFCGLAYGEVSSFLEGFQSRITELFAYSAYFAAEDKNANNPDHTNFEMEVFTDLDVEVQHEIISDFFFGGLEILATMRATGAVLDAQQAGSTTPIVYCDLDRVITVLEFSSAKVYIRGDHSVQGLGLESDAADLMAVDPITFIEETLITLGQSLTSGNRHPSRGNVFVKPDLYLVPNIPDDEDASVADTPLAKEIKPGVNRPDYVKLAGYNPTPVRGDLDPNFRRQLALVDGHTHNL